MLIMDSINIRMNRENRLIQQLKFVYVNRHNQLSSLLKIAMETCESEMKLKNYTRNGSDVIKLMSDNTMNDMNN